MASGRCSRSFTNCSHAAVSASSGLGLLPLLAAGRRFIARSEVASSGFTQPTFIVQGRDAFLGDVVVSSSIIRYDYEKQYDGRISISKALEDKLRRAPEGVSSILATLEGEHQQANILKRAAAYLENLQAAAKDLKRRGIYDIPEANTDRLFSSEYRHKHRAGCAECNSGDASCETAVLSCCDDIDCDPASIIRPAGSWHGTSLFAGRIVSGNTVMKSAQDRDRLAKQEELIALEMESAGAWEEFPCLMVKGLCDYSDSHKNKDWQDFASATAASVARALIERFVSLPAFEDNETAQKQEPDMAIGSNQGLLEGPTSGNVWGNQFGPGANVNTGTIFGDRSWATGHGRCQ